MDTDLISQVLWEDDAGHKQIRLTINEFRDKEYLHVREYFLDFDESWCPTSKGVHFPISIETVKNFFIAAAKIISEAESKEIIEEYFGDTIRDIHK